MYKQCNVVMLSTQKAENSIVISKGKAWYFKGYFTQDYLYSLGKQSNHLYITSNDEIKEGDCYIDDTNTIRKSITSDKDYWSVRTDYKKIIATTDSSLITSYDNRYTDVVLNNKSLNNQLPQIPQQFIEHYVSEYNKSNVITDVMVEYDEGKYNLDELRERHLKGLLHLYSYCNLKLTNNTINIKPVKDSWSKKEVIELLKKAWYQSQELEETVEEWIEQNL